MLCVEDCISRVFREKEGKPCVYDASLCNRCSHCLAVCPKDAVENDNLDTSQVRKIKNNLLDPDAFREIAESRRSVRRFKDKPVPKEVITEILDLARYSPTASNLQQVGYIVILDGARIQKAADTIFSFARGMHKRITSSVGKKVFAIAKMTPFSGDMERYIEGLDDYITEHEKTGRDFILHNAPALILVTGPKKGHFHGENAGIATACIMNYAHAKGLGTCCIGFLTLASAFFPSLRKTLEIPKGKKVCASIVLGYPAYRHTKTVSRKPLRVKWVEE